MLKIKGACPQNVLKGYWTPDVKRTALLALISTSITSVFVHGFLFSNEFFSHDSLGYRYFFDKWTVAYYTSLGRFSIPVYERIKGTMAAPWIIGMLFTLWMALSVFLIVRLLRIRTTSGIALTGALLCSNLAMTLTGATYVYCMDEYAFALFTAVAAVCLFQKGRWWILPGLALLVVSAGIYQAYFITAACLCVLVITEQLIEGQRCVRAFLDGIRYLGLLATGFVLYYVAWWGLCAVRDTTMSRTNESILSQGLGQVFQQVQKAYTEYLRSMLTDHGVLIGLMTAVHMAVLVLLAVRLLAILWDKELPVANKALLVVLIFMLPVAFNASRILFPSSATRLTNFSWELLYVLLVVCTEPRFRKPWIGALRTAAAVLLCCVLWHHAVYANHVYMKKELEKNATISLATRMVDRIELLEGYVPGETPVAFVGSLNNNTYLNRGRQEFENIDHAVGLWKDYAATYNMNAYLTKYLNYPLEVDTKTDFSKMEQVQGMPSFPAADSIQMINGTVVVRLS